MSDKCKKTIAIVMTTHNAERYIAKTLGKILGQTEKPDEIIIVDDASTDATYQICKSITNCSPEVSLLRLEVNSGPGVARNTGFKLVKSDYVLFLDDDDYVDEDLIKELNKRLKLEDFDVAIYGCRFFDQNIHLTYDAPWVVKKKNIPEGVVFSSKQIRGSIFDTFVGWAWDKVFKVTFLKENKIEFAQLRNSEDLVMVYHAIVIARKLTYIDMPLIYHQVARSGSVSSSISVNWLDPYRATSILYDRLSSYCDSWPTIKNMYIKWAMHFILWAIVSNNNIKLKELLFSDRLPLLEFGRRPILFYKTCWLDPILLAFPNQWEKRWFKIIYFLCKILYVMSEFGLKYSLNRCLYHLKSIDK